MDKKKFDELQSSYSSAKKLSNSIDSVKRLIDGIRKRKEKGSSEYEVTIRRKADNYANYVHVTVSESIVAAMVPSLTEALNKLREEFKSL